MSPEPFGFVEESRYNRYGQEAQPQTNYGILFLRVLYFVLQLLAIIGGLAIVSLAITAKNNSTLRFYLLTINTTYSNALWAAAIFMIIALAGIVAVASRNRPMVAIYIIAIAIFMGLACFYTLVLENRYKQMDIKASNQWDNLDWDTISYLQAKFNCCGFHEIKDRAAMPCHNQISCFGPNSPIRAYMGKVFRAVTFSLLPYTIVAAILAVILATYITDPKH